MNPTNGTEQRQLSTATAAQLVNELPHAPTVCGETNSWYYHRSTARTGHWTFEFTCPACGRQGKFQRNYQGLRKVFCDGVKFERRDAPRANARPEQPTSCNEKSEREEEVA